MWFSLWDGGNEYIIKIKDVTEVYTNEECSWLSIKTIKNEIVVTTKDVSSSDVLGYPTIIHVDSPDEILSIHKQLQKILGFEDPAQIIVHVS